MSDPAAKPSMFFSFQVLRGEFEHFWVINSADLGGVGTLATMDRGGSLTPLRGLLNGGLTINKKDNFLVKKISPFHIGVYVLQCCFMVF